ncbi:SusC/RagA family TonB-linked outer membrane protein [Joostella sp.]|uniref:SusC/RagA family TonB-linked outer membrane protein n=1 Tax=Joostella sp. TaxID=2231138 RepID=UPI003A8ED505
MNNQLKKPRLLRIALFVITICYVIPFYGNSDEISINPLNAIQTVINGTVSSEDGLPIPGVNIMIKGTTNGVVSDFDGNYEINVSNSNTTLVFSYIGFTSQEIVVGDQKIINITLKEDVSKLEEVVVVGYGTQKKETLTGAVSTVSSETIENRPVTNVTSALQGTTAGLNITRTSGQPGEEGLGIQIRGATSANGATEPLLLVDGVTSPLSMLQSINPNDIESVTVLKDGAAAAIYGARAAGGVILVTTKIGKEGKTIIQYEGRVTSQWSLNEPVRLSLLEEAEYSNLARENAGIAPEYSEFDLNNIKNGTEFVVDPNNPSRYITYNQKSIKDQILRDQYLMQSHNISARGGSEKIKHLFSFGYLDQEGIMKVGPDDYKRWNLRSNVSAEISDKITLDTRISYSSEGIESPSRAINGYGLLQQVYQARQRFPIFTPDGKLFGGAGSSGNNTYAYLTEGGYTNDDTTNLNGIFNLTAKDLIKGFTFRTIYGRQEERIDYENFNRTVELWDRGGPVYYLNNPNSYNVSSTKNTTENFQLLVDYDVLIANNHKIHALIGYQWEDYRSANINSSASSLSSNDIPSLNLGDINSKQNSENKITYANQSVFGRLNYTFKDKYLIEGTLRMDQSSRLSPELRSKWFPSISGGWNMQKEEWFSNILPFVSEFKPRVSWGQLGNANADIIGYYDYLNLLNLGNSLVMGQNEDRASYFYQSNLPSLDLSWETVETFNYGVDFALLQNKLQGTFDFYQKYNRNMLIPTTLPATIGISTPRVNEGELKSWGWEASLSYRGEIGENFNFSISANISDNQNELVNYGGNTNTIQEGVNTLVEGESLNTIWGYKTKPGYIESQTQLDNAPFYSNQTGIGDIEYIDQNGDGLINVGGGNTADHGDLVKLGNNQPRYLYGFTLKADWKSIDFSVFFQGVGKRSFLPSRYIQQPFLYAWIQPMDIHKDYWTPDNPDAAFPRPYLSGDHNYATSDRWIVDGSYLRLKNIQLGYSIPQKQMDKLPLDRVRLYLSAENILTFTNMGVYDGVIDPEQRNNVHADYPFTGSIAFGVNLTF